MAAHPSLPPLDEAALSDHRRRLGPIGDGSPADRLAAFQLAHLRAVPFENLDLHRGRRIVLDHDAIAAKLIGERRGGYCYELNSLAGRHLAALGFAVTLLSAEVATDDGGFSPPFDHLTLLVSGAGLDEPHLVDVGFGDAFDEPLPLRDGFRRIKTRRTVGLDRDGDRWHYVADDGDGLRARYRFRPDGHRFDEFAERNDWQQDAPDSHFAQGELCTRLRPDGGRTTLAGRRLIETDPDGTRTETDLTADEVDEALARHFDLLPPRR